MSCGDDGSDGHAQQTDSQSAIMVEIVTVRVMVLVVESSDGNGCVLVTSEQFMFVMVIVKLKLVETVMLVVVEWSRVETKFSSSHADLCTVRSLKQSKSGSLWLSSRNPHSVVPLYPFLLLLRSVSVSRPLLSVAVQIISSPLPLGYFLLLVHLRYKAGCIHSTLICGK